MVPKKTKRADLENKSSLFLLLGLVISLGIVFAAFEWKTSPKKADSLGEMQQLEVEEEIIPVTREPQQAPPPPPPKPQVVEVLNIVKDDVKIDNEIDIEDSEADDETIIDVDPVVVEAPKEKEKPDKIFTIVEEKPEFPGGYAALQMWLKDHVKYPTIAQENGVQGKVYVKFVVNKDGSIVNVEILRGVDLSLDKEAVRVVKSMPKWKPGKQRGKPVRVSYNVPINFVLQ